MRKLLRLVVAISLFGAALVVGASSPVTAAPNDGNGKKIVVDITDGPFPIDCGAGGTLTFVFEFTGQFMPKANGRNELIAVFSSEGIYTNDAGDTYVFKDAGSDRFYLDDGVLVQAITGRSILGNIGRLVIEDPNGDAGGPNVVFQKGQAVDVDAIACDELT
jgi:hypothetical protein